VNHFSEKVSLIWNVADQLRGDYKQSEYGRVILPFLVLRRLDQVVAPTRAAVWEADQKFPAGATAEALRERMLQKAAGQSFYNISQLDFEKLRADANHIAANLRGYIAGFSANVPDAWVDESKTKIGYEIPFTRHFYVYTRPRPLNVIEAEIRQLEAEIQGMLAEVLG